MHFNQLERYKLISVFLLRTMVRWHCSWRVQGMDPTFCRTAAVHHQKQQSNHSLNYLYFALPQFVTRNKSYFLIQRIA